MPALPDAARQLIAALDLAPLPHEGGYFRQTWRSATGSAIYFLITPADFSALHRIAQDEIWHYYAGDPIEHLQLDERTGNVRIARLGSDVLAGDVPQLLVPASVWQVLRCSVAPSRRRGTNVASSWLPAPRCPRHFPSRRSTSRG